MIGNFKEPALPEGLITTGLERSVGETAVPGALQLSCLSW